MRNPTAAERAALRAFLDRHLPEIIAAFERAVYTTRARADLAEVERLLQLGDIEALVDLLHIDGPMLNALEEAVRSTYIAGGQSAVAGMQQGLVATFGFNGGDVVARSWIERNGANLVQGIVDDSRDAIRRFVTVALSEEGRATRSVALDIVGRIGLQRVRTGGIIGLTAEQTEYAIRAREELTRLDPHYFTRTRRDARFDSLVRRAMREGRRLSVAEIDRIVGRYKDRLLQRRGETIARDQVNTARAASRREAMRQILERPDVETITKRWQLGFPKEHRPNHVALNGQVKNYDEDFDFGGGITAHGPHDDSLPASEKLGCQCTIVYRVKLKKS
ncbi:hypothetical protein C4N9_20900 [Pararhodobacter marinus]|uniref:Phage head morphogenesis domain-containing protein n=1 Tax=Pararhodobacter marinus TaxID=2184063 RepID=A0A2U2C4A5_9RHOB|nr:phage minor head protein [Pararhodobacter marinus]PWE26720.1 hypothetical protein C4N9_20900 [Pararhodobacter marinus]